MRVIETTDGPVYVDRRRMLEKIEGLSDEVVVVVQAGAEPFELESHLMSADLVCVGDPFTEAVKRVRPELAGVDRSDLLVPRLPAAARLGPLRMALEASEAEEVNLAEILATQGWSVAVIPA